MGAAPVLTISKDGQDLKSQPLEGEVVLGRGEGCVIRLDDRAVSREHAVFRAVAGGVQVEKKSEVAPLSVNGAECTRAIVKEGDVISIGPYLVKLSMSGAPASAPSPAEPVVAAASEIVPAVPIEASDDIPNLEAGLEPDLAPAVPALGDATVSTAAPAPDGLLELAPPPVDESNSDSSPDLLVPQFSMDAASAGHVAPLELGEISVDEEGKTKLIPAAKVSAKLIFSPGAANITELLIDKDEVSIGRGKDCDVILDDKKASRRHAIIRRAGVNFSVKDLGSANGIYVNDNKVEEQELSGDDILRIGGTEFRFLVLSEEYAEKQDHFLPVPEEPTPSFAGGFHGDPVPTPPPASNYYTPPSSVNLDMPKGAVSIGLGIPGIAGMPKRKETLLEKYRALPPRRRALWTAVIIGALYFGLFDEPEKAPPKKAPVAVSKEKPAATFENLTPEQKKFVESQHALAFDYYKNRDYDKAIFEIEKIFALLPDYKDSREIERYAKEGKRKLEALEEEKRKKEEEEKLKLRIADLVAQAKTAMDQKKYDQVHELIPQILALDPDNLQVSEWRKQLDQLDEEKRIADQQKSVQEQINLRAWDVYKEGLALKKQSKYREAIETFSKVSEIGATDKKPEHLAQAQIKEIHELIAQVRDPILEEAKQAEDSQDLVKAFGLYKKATEIDPEYPVGYAGMDRIRGILHERAKALYIDAVLAESYSDFEMAKKKFLECREVAPKDDVYYERAERRLATFFKPKEEQPPQ